MPEYIIGMDRLFSIEADTPQEACAELADRINNGELDVEPSACCSYEEVPTDE